MLWTRRIHAQTHEKAADLALSKLRNIKIGQILLSAITTGGIIAVVFGDPTVSHISAIVAAILSTTLLALTATRKIMIQGSSRRNTRRPPRSCGRSVNSTYRYSQT